MRKYTKEDFKSHDSDIRKEAYEKLGYTKDAFKDKEWYIRLYAYRQLGFTKDALKDNSYHVKTDAKLYFRRLNKKFIKNWKNL